MKAPGRRNVSGLYVRKGFRQFRQTVNGTLFRLTQTFRRAPEKLLVAPSDIRASDAFLGEEILNGRITLAGRTLEFGDVSPFSVEMPSPEFEARLHGFGWLRDVRATRSEVHYQKAQDIAKDWITAYRGPDETMAWEPEVAALRLTAWFSHSPVILKGAPLGFYRRFLKSIGLHIEYLKAVAPGAREGLESMRVRIALAMATLALPASAAAIQRAGAALDRELDFQILMDGGHVSRDPRAILELLMELLPLKQTYVNLGVEVPSRLIPAIDRMFPALRFFRHQGGELALFNGATSTLATELVAVLRYDETAGQPFKAMPYMQYQRLASRDAVLIVDTGHPITPETSAKAHAGCLAFEFSSGKHRFIINAGSPTNGPEEYRQLARSTAAHSTVTISDTSSASFSRFADLGMIVTGGVAQVGLERTEDAVDGEVLVARHDGYKDRFDLIHERTLQMKPGGVAIRGRDRLMKSDLSEPDPNCGLLAVARFHLHPAIQIKVVDDNEVLLIAPDAQTWSLTCFDAPVVIGEDVFFADSSGIRASQQIEIAFDAGTVAEIQWLLSQKSRFRAS